MLYRSFSTPVTLLAAMLSLSALQPARADEPPAPPVVQGEPAPPPKDNERPRRREGGPREDGPQGDGPREGGLRRRGEGGPPPPGGMMGMNETPEQRAERTKRMLRPYLEMVPDLNEDQQTHIVAILDASAAEVRAIRASTTFSTEERALRVTKLRSLLPEHIKIALTDAQIVTYSTAYAAFLQTQADMEKIGSVRPDEGVEELRARVLQGYEPVFEELSVKQKTQIIKTLEAAAEESATVQADTKLTPDQKLQALRKIHDGVSAKVTPLLDADQKKTWNKAHGAKRP